MAVLRGSSNEFSSPGCPFQSHLSTGKKDAFFKTFCLLWVYVNDMLIEINAGSFYFGQKIIKIPVCPQHGLVPSVGFSLK